MKKKNIKKRVIIVVSVIVVALIAAGVIAGPVLMETSKMSPLATGEVIPGIYAIKDGYVNMFLIKAPGGKYIAVDAGSNASIVRNGLDSLGIPISDVSAVIMTHTHGDHTGALSVFENAAVYGSVNTKFNSITKTLSDGESVEIEGISVKCFDTPGHYEDSVSYLINGEILFTGDTLSLRNNKVGLFVSRFNSSDEQQELDIKKLAGITGVQYIITAHFGFTDRAIFP